MDGRVVIVTGASTGICRAVALAFGQRGAHVVVADVDHEPRPADAEGPGDRAAETAGGAG